MMLHMSYIFFDMVPSVGLFSDHLLRSIYHERLQLQLGRGRHWTQGRRLTIFHSTIWAIWWSFSDLRINNIELNWKKFSIFVQFYDPLKAEVEYNVTCIIYSWDLKYLESSTFSSHDTFFKYRPPLLEGHTLITIYNLYFSFWYQQLF